MKKGRTIALAACAAVMAASAAKAADAAKTLREGFDAPPPGYGEVPFWWWSGREPLDKERMLEQIEELHKAGIAGVQVNYAHYRTGTRPTQDSTPPLFSDEWWDYFSFAAQECAKRGMGISLSNYTLDFPEAENLWRKIGISTPDMRATELARENGKIVKRKVSRTYDPLNPESGKRVVERFFNPFMEKVPEHLRGGLNYFFQDELILTRDILWLWSDDFPAEFKKRKGYDIEPMLPALFGDFGPDTVKVRLDMNDVTSALACERYYKPIYDWHASRGLIYGCDQATRGKHPMSKYIDYMRVMKYFTAPGFDTPGRSADIIKNKVGSSIAHLNGRPRVWLEGYHSQGWQASTSTIFDSTCHNYLYGSNLLNLHGLYYSTYGGWWEWAPPCYHFRMPYWTYMKTFLKYFERLSYVLSQGDHVCDVAVVNPLEPCVYDRNRGNVSVGVSHDIVRRLVTEAQTDVDFIDADSLARATVVGRVATEAPKGKRQAYDNKVATLCVAGEAYRMVILPDMVAIRRSSLEKLVKFKRAGGVVVVLGDKPKFTDAPHTEKAKIDALVSELTTGTTGILPVALPAKPSAAQLKEIAGAVGTPDFRAPGNAKALHRRIGKYDVYFICDLAEMGECTFRATGTPELWNPWDGTQKALTEFRRNADGTTIVRIAGDGAPKLVVFAEDTASVQQQEVPCATWLAPSSGVTLDGEWDFTLKPTLDNKWGDFRLPVRERYIGAEIRRVKMVGAKDLGLPEEMTVSYGPQFMEVEGRAEAHPALKPFIFSWREGVEDMPGFQDWHHGLNGVVGDDFFVLGPYSRKQYDVSPPRGAKPGPCNYLTYVYAPCDCRAKPVAHGVEPKSITIDGTKRIRVGEEVALSAGYHPLLLGYEAFGRAALVMMRTDVKSVPSKLPLSMRWYNDPAVLPFAPFGGSPKEGVYTATLPPGCEEVEITMRGTLLSANIAGVEAEVVERGVLDAPHERIYFVRPKMPCKGVAALTLKVAHEPGFIGGAAFTEPMRLKCGKGRIALGNWALIADGLRFYSGGAVYEKSFTLTREQATAPATLDLGGVGVCCGVSVNGGEEKVLCCPPWRVEVGGILKEGENTLKVTVYNTLNNHYQTIPTRYRTTVEDAPSGLIGPVTLHFSAAFAHGAEAHECYSGIYPHLAMFNDEGECGTGAVVPWAGDLWVVTYGPHCPAGSSDKLYRIKPDLTREVFPGSVGGTPANRLVHRETNQLLIGPYVIDAKGNVRVVSPSKMPGRLTGAARHLADPSNKVYVATMETGLYELDMRTLSVNTLIRENGMNDGRFKAYLEKLGMPWPDGWDAAPRTRIPGYHSKGLASGFGRVFISNNGENSEAARRSPFVPSGVLAWWNEPGRDWTTIRRCQFTEVTTPDGIYGNEHPDGNPVWAMGWDAKSVILGVTTNGESWAYYRLPKASHCYDGAHGWNTEWPRIRDVGFGDGTLLATMHGTFWRFPRDFSPANPNGIRPISTYLKVIGDFCRWGDYIVFGCDDQARMEFLGKRGLKKDAPRVKRSQSNLWFVKPEGLKSFGPPSGEGYVWLDEDVKAGDVSDPYLHAGYASMRFSFVRADGSEVRHELLRDGDWVRVKCLEDAKRATARFRYGPAQCATPALDAKSPCIEVTDDKGKSWRFPNVNGDTNVVCREIATERDLLYVGGVWYEVPAENAGGFAALRPIALADGPVKELRGGRGLMYLDGRAMAIDDLWRNGTSAAAYWLWEKFAGNTKPPFFGIIPGR